MTEFYQVSPSDESNTPINIPTAPPEPHQNASIRAAGGVTSISFKGDSGDMTTTKHGTVSASDLTPYADDDWRATARNAYGNPTSKITGDSVVEIDGMSAQVDMFVKAGVLVETADGFVRASNGATQGQQGEQQQEPAEPGAMSAEEVEVVNAALEGMSDSVVQKGASLSIAAAVGDMTIEDVVAGVALDTGMDPGEAAERTQSAIAPFQAQADNFITRHLGVSARDLGDFYAFCRQPENKGALQTAIQQQVFGNSMTGYKALADRYFAGTAPSVAVLQANGFETKTGHDGEELVRIQGTWIPLKVAARVGLV
jgi:hypothetical protein